MAAVQTSQTRLDVSDFNRLSYQTGAGGVELRQDGIKLALVDDLGLRYSDAQLDDYHHDGMMRWQAPIYMSVHARFSHGEDALRGTAGFGFWNDPFGMTKIGARSSNFPRIRFPQAVWYFFAGPPSQMPLAQEIPGTGWKVATIDAGRALAKMLLPLAPFGMLACRVSWLYPHIWPLAQSVLKIDEAMVPVQMDSWHKYEMRWEAQSVRFVVDGETLFTTRFAPRGPLGFVAWIDNQYMVATPQGKIRHGVVAAGSQWMELAGLEVTAGSEAS